MKLNNRGIAISAILYMILIFFIILVFSILSILSSRKLVLNKIQEEVYNDVSHLFICKAVISSTYGNVPKGNYDPGDEYICEVKPGTKYHFYVLSEDSENVNLIMDSNINIEGQPVVSNVDNKGLVAWITEDDYKSAIYQKGIEFKTCTSYDGVCDDVSNSDSKYYWWYGYWLEGIDSGYNVLGNTTQGPITAINYLSQATSNWSLIPNINKSYDYDDSIEGLEFTVSGKARLPEYDEFDIYFTGDAPWLKTNLDKVGTGGVSGYWSLDTVNGDFFDVWYISYGGVISGGIPGYCEFSQGDDWIDTTVCFKDRDKLIKVNGGVAMDYYNGVRPVITIPKNKISNIY